MRARAPGSWKRQDRGHGLASADRHLRRAVAHAEPAENTALLAEAATFRAASLLAGRRANHPVSDDSSI
jgi:hypothetical protein